MKKVLTAKGSNVIVNIGDYAEIVENGVDVGDSVFGNAAIYLINDVASIPAGVKTLTYCYTVADGFYENPNFAFNPTPEITELQAQNAQIILALVMNDLM